MSGEGPESIPTSADPRSKRPVKKRALSPVSAHAKHVGSLFTRPEQEIRVPPAGAGNARSRVAAPPEIVTNVQGSSAGAGSGEFHVYKASRRREYERLRRMDEEVQREKEAEDFDQSRAERAARDEEKTRRNREKREKKMKARKGKGKAHTTSAPPPTGPANGGAAAPASLPPNGRREGNNLPPEHNAADTFATPGSAEAAATDDGGVAGDDGPGLLIHDDD